MLLVVCSWVGGGWVQSSPGGVVARAVGSVGLQSPPCYTGLPHCPGQLSTPQTSSFQLLLCISCSRAWLVPQLVENLTGEIYDEVTLYPWPETKA